MCGGYHLTSGESGVPPSNIWQWLKVNRNDISYHYLVTTVPCYSERAQRGGPYRREELRCRKFLEWDNRIEERRKCAHKREMTPEHIAGSSAHGRKGAAPKPDRRSRRKPTEINRQYTLQY
ncbi:unnamed protein product, partial [Iphiclides podalirius]